jgi:fatty-acid desaturase
MDASSYSGSPFDTAIDPSAGLVGGTTKVRTAWRLPRLVPWPECVAPAVIKIDRLYGIALFHGLCVLACFPYFFSWTGVFLLFAGWLMFGTLGINLCYHRLLTHRSFRCPLWLEHFFAILGICCLEHSPSRWVATHRLHHQHTDKPGDPHSPLVAFLWAHFGWIVEERKGMDWGSIYEQYAKDLLRDPFYRRLRRGKLYIWIQIVHVTLFYLVGFLIGWLSPGGSVDAGVQFGWSLFVWGVVVRTVVVWNITWLVNSITHQFGYRTYETHENSHNHWLIALLSAGEGWHNNHHADQRSASFCHKWWEFDLTYLIICGLGRLGLATDIIQPAARSSSGVRVSRRRHGHVVEE